MTAKKATPLLYKIAKPVLTPLYKLWYNPKIIGKENIPKEGPVIIVGNHIHIMDQCNIIISTKRCIYYMAKKEYFDKKYKEGKFPWFFKQTGCIPVDRSKKDDKAIESALEVLKNQKVLGLFPEGTRNSIKEEKIKELYNNYYRNKIKYNDFFKKIKKNKTSFINYLEELKEKKIITKREFLDNLYDANAFLKKLIKSKKITIEDYYNHILLPLKFGAVSLAKKTDAYIVPYAITGNYKFRSKNLLIRIGKPFKIKTNLEEANLLLEQKIKSLIKENETISEK